MEGPILIPIEYRHIFDKIPQNEVQSFYHSLNIFDDKGHPYEMILKAIEKTLSVYDMPSPYWFFLYGKLCFVTANYEALLDFWDNSKFDSQNEIAPFVGRIYAFQNNYDEAISISSSNLANIDPELELNLLDTILLFEGNFTLGLSYAYARKFEEAKSIITRLEQYSARYIFKRTITDEYFLDYVFIENIIKSYTAFFSGNPMEMGDILNSMKSWVENIKDPWLQGIYYNVFGINKLMFQELSAGENALKRAYEKFEQVHDLRGFSTVGANIGVALITKGQRKEGREYLENVIQPMAKMKNYWLAIGNTQVVVKTYLDEKNLKKAKELLDWAEKLAEEGEISEPNIYSMFSYFYAQLGDMQKSEKYLVLLKDLSLNSDDLYAKTFYLHASSVHALVKGNISSSLDYITKGIEIADGSGYYNYSLELTILKLEVIMKHYLIDTRIEVLNNAAEVLTELIPLVSLTENPYYETLYYLIFAYTNLAMNIKSGAQEYFEQAKELSLGDKTSAQYAEVMLFEERFQLVRDTLLESQENQHFIEFSEKWLPNEYLSMFYVLEAMRLLHQLQFERTSLGQQQGEEAFPIMLFVINSGGITIYTHRFDPENEIDEVLIGGFLSALTTFGQELFGGGMLTRIDQENHVLLIDKISANNILILLVNEETYMIRKKFKNFSHELSKNNIVDYLSLDLILSKHDPAFQQMEELIDEIFMNSI